MRKNMNISLLFLLIISINIAFGNSGNKTNISKSGRSHAKLNTTPIAKAQRMKRSLIDDDDVPLHFKTGHNKYYKQDSDEHQLTERDTPFWANRGRRVSSLAESDEYPLQEIGRFVNKLCKSCYSTDASMDHGGDIKSRRDELPFWGNRGRRSSEEIEEPFWGNRGRRQDSQDDPFWGTRGRRQDDSPFWGNRGRREDEPFWGNRGRREDEPFWENRGRREEEPFWGNRGRRQQEPEPFWGNRGRREDVEPFWGNRGRRKQDLKESILEAISVVEGDIENLSRMRRGGHQTSFWTNRARESKLKNLFNGSTRIRLQSFPNYLKNVNSNSNEPGTVHDNRMYAEEPHYILVDRSSRSSAEDDPYYISRGKKYYLDLSKVARDRRGAIEEIVKSVRNDPYYIARGKKDSVPNKINNSTAPREDFAKARDLICSTLELIAMKPDGNINKREVNDPERERRTILKKLAAQLQMDPYFVSRGKKSEDDDTLEFITDVASKCN